MKQPEPHLKKMLELDQQGSRRR